MELMHVAVDLDDVVLDFVQGVRTSFHLEYGEDPFPEFGGSSWGQEVVDFYHHPYFLESGHKDWWGWLREREWLWGKVFLAVPGAVGGIKRLREDGNYMECITSKPPWAEFSVWQFQGRYRVPFNRITIVTNGQRKVDYTDAPLLVDDRQQTCQEFVDAGRLAILFDRTGKVLPKPPLYVAHNWADVVTLVREIREGFDE